MMEKGRVIERKRPCFDAELVNVVVLVDLVHASATGFASAISKCHFRM